MRSEEDDFVLTEIQRLVDAQEQLVHGALTAILSRSNPASVEELGRNCRKRIDSTSALCAALINCKPQLSATLSVLQERLRAMREWLDAHWPWVNHAKIAEAEAELDRGEGLSARDIIDELQAPGGSKR